jgi:hypothetical protein
MRLVAIAAALVLAAIGGVCAQDSKQLEGERERDDSEPLTPQKLDSLLARYAHEPRIDDVVKASLAAARHDPQRFVDMARRARLRGLLPHLDIGARRGQGIDLRWTTADDIDTHRTTADDLLLFATVRFDLDRLLFTGEEVSIAREARFERQAQHELVRQVVHLYFLRLRLMIERDLHGEQSLGQQLKIAEAEAMLEAFTDGAFRRMLKSSATAWKTAASTNASTRP